MDFSFGNEFFYFTGLVMDCIMCNSSASMIFFIFYFFSLFLGCSIGTFPIKGSVYVFSIVQFLMVFYGYMIENFSICV